MKNNKTLKLMHLANFNSTNIGNGALIRGLETTLEEDSPISIEWQREPWDDYTFGLVDFDKKFVEKVNASDGLIVGGAVTFNGRDYNNQTGSRFELPHELWSKIIKPVIFYGLSYRHWQGQTYHHLDKLRLTIEKILSSEHMILSVRNDGTRTWLKEFVGIESNKIVEIPDSAVFVPTKDEEYHSEIFEDVKNIMLSFNDEDAPNRFDHTLSKPDFSNHSRDYIIDELVHSSEQLAENYNVNLILCPHYFDDYRMMSEFIERIQPRIAHQRMVSTGLCRVKDTDFFYGRYKKADLSISMRVHSMSPCIGLGTPMIAYTTQNRMTDFLERIGLKDLSVDAFELSSGSSLYNKAKFALDNSQSVRQRFSQVRESLREETRKFHEQIFQLLTF
jgi:polysaccharide pyruvyl transferase WcaK-like protein